MPVVTVTAPPLDDVQDALISLTQAIAAALDLPPDSVFATSVASGPGVLGATPHSWPVVVIHGSRRDPERMTAAIRAAEAAVRAAWQVSDVWVQWLAREDPP